MIRNGISVRLKRNTQAIKIIKAFIIKKTGLLELYLVLIISYFLIKQSIMVYKYTTYKWLPEILINNTLHFSCPLDFNDAFDSYVNIKGKMDSSKDDINKIINSPGDETLKKLFLKITCQDNNEEKKRFAEAKEKVARRLLVLSLSALKDSTLMWGHYADSLKGFCIGFKPANFIIKETDGRNIAELGNSNSNNLECLVFENDSFDLDGISQGVFQLASGIALKVASKEYPKEFICLPLHEIKYRSSNNMPEAFDFFKYGISLDPKIKEIEFKKLVSFFEIKNDPWQYEKEKRIIITGRVISKDKCKDNNVKFEKSLLKEIIFGINTPETHKLCIRSLTEKMGYKDVEFFQAERSKGKYEIEIKRLHN